MRLHQASLLLLPLFALACGPDDSANDGVLTLGADSGVIIIGGDADAAADAAPTETIGLACDMPGGEPGPPCGSGLCVRSPDGAICSRYCEDGGCPDGFECRALDRDVRHCLPVDPRCPPDGPVLGRDPACGCLSGWPVDTDDGPVCTRACGEGCPAEYGCDVDDTCVPAVPLVGDFIDRTPVDGATVTDGTLWLRWVFESRAAVDNGGRVTFDVYLGPVGADPPLYSAGRGNQPEAGRRHLLRGSMPIPEEVRDAGGAWHWKVVARQGEGVAESAVWRFELGGPGPVQRPCPDVPSVRIGRQNYSTVRVGNDCWIEESFPAGEPAGGPDGLTSYDDGRVQHVRRVGGGYFYTWWEAHNSYGDRARDVTAVGRSMCPDGWRLPTQSEWRRAVTLGNQINPDAETSGIDLSLSSGLFNVRDAEIDTCPADDGQQWCSTFAEHVGEGTFYFWAADEGDATEAAFVRVARPGRGSSDYTFGTGRNAPTFGMQVRCIADE